MLLSSVAKCLKTFVDVAIREKSKLKEDILARRQKKLLMRHARQKYLEESALREAELLQELDRFGLLIKDFADTFVLFCLFVLEAEHFLIIQ